MPDQIQKGYTFNDGDVVTGASLNALADEATSLPGLITEHASISAAVGDKVLLQRGVALYQSDVSAFAGTVTSIGLAMPTSEFTVTGSPVTASGTLTAAWKPQAGNVFLAGTGGSAAFRTLASRDFALPTSPVYANDIDWSLGNLFYRLLVSVVTFTFSNLRDGQTIKVMCQQDSFGSRVVHWPTGIGWKGAAYPAPQSTAASAIDIYEFTCYGGTVVFGKGDMGYMVID